MAKFNGTVDQIESTANKVNDLNNADDAGEKYPSAKAVADAVEVKVAKRSRNDRETLSTAATQYPVGIYGVVKETTGNFNKLIDGSYWVNKDENGIIHGNIPIRNKNGSIQVNTVDSPEEWDAANVNYVTKKINQASLSTKKEIAKAIEKVVPIIPNHTSLKQAYISIINDDGEYDTALYPFEGNDSREFEYGSDNIYANSIPIRNPKGNLYTGMPTEMMEAVPKKYVDEISQMDITHTRTQAEVPFNIQSNRVYLTFAGSGGEISLQYEDGSSVTDDDGKSIEAFKVCALVIPKNMTSDGKEWNVWTAMLVYYNSVLDFGVKKFFIPATTLEDGSVAFPKIRFINNKSSQTIWELH